LRKMERDKFISQDQNRRSQERLQKATDAHIKTIDEVAVTKEAEIMQV
jgi:ribosome recycling factor